METEAKTEKIISGQTDGRTEPAELDIRNREAISMWPVRIDYRKSCTAPDELEALVGLCYSERMSDPGADTRYIERAIETLLLEDEPVVRFVTNELADLTLGEERYVRKHLPIVNGKTCGCSGETLVPRYQCDGEPVQVWKYRVKSGTSTEKKAGRKINPPIEARMAALEGRHCTMKQYEDKAIFVYTLSDTFAIRGLTKDLDSAARLAETVKQYAQTRPGMKYVGTEFVERGKFQGYNITVEYCGLRIEVQAVPFDKEGTGDNSDRYHEDKDASVSPAMPAAAFKQNL